MRRLHRARSAERAASHACCRPGGRRDARGDPRGGEARGHHAAARPGRSRRARPSRTPRRNFLGYHGFPAVICASVNDEVDPRHPRRARRCATATCCRSTVVRSSTAGTAMPRSRWASAPIDDDAQRLIDAADRGAGRRPSPRCVPGGHLGDVGAAIESVVTAAGYGSPRDYCGHGIGRAMHEEPDVENRGRRGQGSASCEPGRGAGDRADADRRRPRRRAASSTTAGPS